MSVDDLRSGTWVTYLDGRAKKLQIRRCRFEIEAGPDLGESIELDAATILIGARVTQGVKLRDSQVSGSHCEITLDETGYRLRDLNSTNGTFIEGFRINDIYIKPGTQITVGASKLRFLPLNDSVERPLAESSTFEGLVGQSVKMRELFARLEKLAPSLATVLISGETGVGKELVAEALHLRSKRSEGPFVVMDCGSIPGNLIESELFGHEKGAFTGATQSFAGAFERAHRGTVVLDEIGELPLSMQPKLLRVLERKQIRRVGGDKTIDVDIRVVAATNRDLGVEVNRGRFREDLYYRLAVACVHLPPLRDRIEDIPLLVEHFMKSMPEAHEPTLAEETIALMMKHDWPGNVRELKNVIERAVVLAEPPRSERSLVGRPRPKLEASHHSKPHPEVVSTDSTEQVSASIDITKPFRSAKQALVNDFERRYVTALLAAHDGNISKAAKAAGIDRMSIHKMLNRLGIDNPGR